MFKYILFSLIGLATPFAMIAVADARYEISHVPTQAVCSSDIDCQAWDMIQDDQRMSDKDYTLICTTEVNSDLTPNIAALCGLESEARYDQCIDSPDTTPEQCEGL